MHTTPLATAPRLHPMMVAAATSVTLVSLVGAAAILGWFPSSHSSALPSAALTAPQQQPMALASVAAYPAPLPAATATRFQTADGRVFEEVPAAVAAQPAAAPALPKAAPVVHRKVVHHYAQNTAYQPRYVQERPYVEPHPIRSYVSDMHPVGTGIGAVVGGVLGNQVGGGNGKKLATVAGVLLGGYAGNEVAHDRNPLPFSNR